MPEPDRRLTARLATFDQRLRLTISTLTNHRRGIRYGRSFPTPASDRFELHRDIGPIELYFDAHTEGNAIWKWRHYFDIYHRHLQKFRERPVHMVEIGVWAGGSLGMWREYLGAASRIYGIDIEPSVRAHAGENVEIFIGDQSDPAFWTEFIAKVPSVDIVLDDGGHELQQQVTSLEALLPHMRPGGVYICEDIVGIANPFHEYVSGLARNLHSNEGWTDLGSGEADVDPTSFQQAIASVHIYPFVTVIEKQATTVGFELRCRGTEWPEFG